MDRKSLVRFGKKVIEVCIDSGIEPIIYGSFLYVHYLGDKNIEVNDIDIYVPEKSFKTLMKAFEKEGIEHHYYEDQHTAHIIQGELKVEIDSLDYWYGGEKDFVDFDFSGMNIRALSLKALTWIYHKASDKSKDHKEEYLGKYKALEKLAKKV